MAKGGDMPVQTAAVSPQLKHLKELFKKIENLLKKVLTYAGI